MNRITVIQYMPSVGKLQAQVTAQWVGKNLAVHKTVGITESKTLVPLSTADDWTLTKVSTGTAVGFFRGSLQKVIPLAKEWDDAFVGEFVSQDLRLKFREALHIYTNSTDKTEPCPAQQIALQ